MKKFFFGCIVFTLFWQSCQTKKNTPQTESDTTITQTPTKTLDSSIQEHIHKQDSNAVTKPLQDPNTLDYISYYDKVYEISLKYPKTWRKELNKYVPFKITAPQEGTSDSMKENFYYVVFDETPDKNDILNKNKKEVLNLEQMKDKMINQLTLVKPNRKDTKVLSSNRVMINGTPAYEIISTGIINGFAMKYRICVIKKDTKQYYLYFATEQYTYERYKPYADLLITSFMIK